MVGSEPERQVRSVVLSVELQFTRTWEAVGIMICLLEADHDQGPGFEGPVAMVGGARDSACGG